eukprot:jgi/Mesvir1/402/Mv11293-RA.1
MLVRRMPWVNAPSFLFWKRRMVGRGAETVRPVAARASSSASEIIFLGSGSSTGVPTPSCLTQPSVPPCKVCHSAVAGPRLQSKNYRLNPSLLIRYVPDERGGADASTDGVSHDARNDADSNGKKDAGAGAGADATGNPLSLARNIIIDVGKTFREAMLLWMVHYKVPLLHAVLLSHEHADAILGLDDLRGLQKPYSGGGPPPPVPVYLSEHSWRTVSKSFDYLCRGQNKNRIECCGDVVARESDEEAPGGDNAAPAGVIIADDDAEGGIVTTGGGGRVNDGIPGAGGNGVVADGGGRGDDKGGAAAKPVVPRYVASLDFRIIRDEVAAPFEAEGLTFTPLPVMHGEDYRSLGFMFGRKERVAYISDVSRILPETMEAITRPEPVDILVLDALKKTGTHPTHFCLEQALDAIRHIRPKRCTLLTGLSHDFDHESTNRELRKLLDKYVRALVVTRDLCARRRKTCVFLGLHTVLWQPLYTFINDMCMHMCALEYPCAGISVCWHTRVLAYLCASEHSSAGTPSGSCILRKLTDERVG